MRSLVVIAGPTASGKSSLALKLAQSFNGEIVSADSRQIYKKMDIGTATASVDDQCLVPHHMIDICEPDECLTLSQYKAIAMESIETIWRRNKIPFLTGGTGLYINSIVYDYQIPEVAPQEPFRQHLEEKEKHEKGCLHRMLSEVDPSSAERLHPNDIRRIVRALEVLEITGKPLSQWQTKSDTPVFPTLFCGLKWPKELLHERIIKRIAMMVEEGIVEEVKHLVAEYSPELELLKTLNYREILEFVMGESSLDEAKENMAIHTRQFAKRQMTWFKKDKNIRWFDMEKKTAYESVYGWLEQNL